MAVMTIRFLIRRDNIEEAIKHGYCQPVRLRLPKRTYCGLVRPAHLGRSAIEVFDLRTLSLKTLDMSAATVASYDVYERFRKDGEIGDDHHARLQARYRHQVMRAKLGLGLIGAVLSLIGLLCGTASFSPGVQLSLAVGQCLAMVALIVLAIPIWRSAALQIYQRRE